MKLSIISDSHLGFALGTERENDSFVALEEALEKSKDCDLILLAGDLFETKTPNIEVLTRSVEILKKFQNGKKDPTPIVAIHGTHERRIKGLLNPVQALGRMGFVGYMHCDKLILEIAGKKIAVLGMSGVPDQYSETVLSEWNPKPEKGAFNILMMHQSIAPFLYAKHLLPLEKIPKGFDLYINGHIHDNKHVEYDNSPFIIPGSLIPTQITSEFVPVGFYKIELKPQKIKNIEFIELDNQRKTSVLKLENSSTKDVEKEIKSVLKEKHKLKPIIKLNLSGKIAINQIKSKYEDKAIIFISTTTEKEDIEAKGLDERIESVQEMGRKLLRQNLETQQLDPKKFERVFELLAEKKIEDAKQELGT